MPTPHGSRGGMAFSADELRVLRRALAEALHPTSPPAPGPAAAAAAAADQARAPGPRRPASVPAAGREGRAREYARLAEAVAEAEREGDRLREFLLADLVRYRDALPGTAPDYLARLRDALEQGYRPVPYDLAALRTLRSLPCSPAEHERRIALLRRCQELAEPGPGLGPGLGPEPESAPESAPGPEPEPAPATEPAPDVRTRLGRPREPVAVHPRRIYGGRPGLAERAGLATGTRGAAGGRPSPALDVLIPARPSASEESEPAEPAPEDEPKPEPESKPESKPEPKPESKPKPEPKPDRERKPDGEPPPKPGPGPAPTPPEPEHPERRRTPTPAEIWPPRRRNRPARPDERAGQVAIG